MAAIRTARLYQPGQPLRLETVELPGPAPGEVVVDLSYAGVNPLDTYVAAGQAGAPVSPHTPGVEGAGVCAGLSVLVYGHGIGLSRNGTWAERVVAPHEAVITIPVGIGALQASVVAVAGATAVRVVDDLAAVAGDDTVLVLGAAGGAGSAVTSLAASHAGRVLGQTAAPAKAAFIESLGAAPVVAATPASLLEQVRSEKVTAVIDALGGGFTTAALTALEPRGRLVSYGTSAGPVGEVDLRAVYRKGLTIRGYGGVIEPAERLRQAIGRAFEALATGAMSIPVTRVLSLDEVGLAIAMLGQRAVAGKLAIAL